MMLAARCRFLEGRVNGPLQNTKDHRWRQVEHFAASGNLALVAVIGNLAVYQRLTVVYTAGSRHIRIRNVLCKQGVVPQFAGAVWQITPEGRGLITWKKHRKTLGAHAKVQMANSHLGHFGFAKRAGTHGFEYS